jgi:hypothetical protein
LVGDREVGYMERPIEPNMGPSIADVLFCTFEVLIHFSSMFCIESRIVHVGAEKIIMLYL